MSTDVKLTDFERECLRLKSQGLTYEEIAKKLMYSRDTISRRLRSAREKLGAGSNTTKAVRIAVQAGLI